VAEKEAAAKVPPSEMFKVGESEVGPATQC